MAKREPVKVYGDVYKHEYFEKSFFWTYGTFSEGVQKYFIISPFKEGRPYNMFEVSHEELLSFAYPIIREGRMEEQQWKWIYDRFNI